MIPFRRAVVPWPDNVIERLAQQYVQSDQLHLPDKEADTRPTEMGNVLAAAADYPTSAYGIDTASIMPRLVQVLSADDHTYTRLRGAESSLNLVLMFSFWAMVWTLLSTFALLIGGGVWWTFPIVLVGGLLLWWIAKEAAITQSYAYGDALKALFDLRRRELLDALGVQLTEDEISKGMTPEEEKKYWWHLYHLIALGGTGDPNFPRLKPPDVASGAEDS